MNGAINWNGIGSTTAIREGKREGQAKSWPTSKIIAIDVEKLKKSKIPPDKDQKDKVGSTQNMLTIVAATSLQKTLPSSKALLNASTQQSTNVPPPVQQQVLVQAQYQQNHQCNRNCRHHQQVVLQVYQWLFTLSDRMASAWLACIFGSNDECFSE